MESWGGFWVGIFEFLGGISLLLVDGGTPGFERGRNLKKRGLKGQDTSELFFNDCRVPVENLLGKEGQGFKMLMNKLQQERLTIAVASIQSCRRSFDDTLAYMARPNFRTEKRLRNTCADYLIIQRKRRVVAQLHLHSYGLDDAHN